MQHLDTAVRSLLRSSEELRVVLETLLVLPEQPEEPSDQNKRILALVSHRDDWDNVDEASLFVCKYRTVQGDYEELDIEQVFPIIDDFSISMAQMRRGTLDLRADASTLALEQRTDFDQGFSLTIEPARSSESYAVEPLTLFTYDVQRLRILVNECRQYKASLGDAKDAALSTSTNKFSWLLPYRLIHDIPHILSSIPLDLRVINTPLYTQLSAATAGFPGYDALDIQLIRDDWIRRRARDAARKERRRLSIRVGTFNVNGKMPSQDLSSWITQAVPDNSSDYPVGEVSPSSRVFSQAPTEFDAKSTQSLESTSLTLHDSVLDKPRSDSSPQKIEVDTDSNPDILILGFQELDLSTEALLYSTSTLREDAWTSASFAALGEKAELYEKIASKQLVGMLIILIVKKSIVSCFKRVRTSSVGAGIMGVLGNKGGTAIRFEFTPPSEVDSLDDSSAAAGATYPGSTVFTIVNAHLAAFDEMVDRRNADFHDLSKRLTFESDVLDQSGMYPLPVSVYESDVLIWMGDLNYRIDLPDLDVRSILSLDEWNHKLETLLKHDQLKKAMRSKNAFDGFSEFPIAHFPTYRFDHNLPTDGLGYDLKRKPAWTDRVLHMAGPCVEVHQLTYTSHPHITMSDHRPVAADFLMDIDVYDRHTYASTARSLYRRVNYMEETSERVVVKLDTTSLDLGQLRYGEETKRTIRLQNAGKVPCAYRFVPLDSMSPIHPEWLLVAPMHGLLLPDEIASIVLTTCIDKKAAAQLNLGPRQVEFTLILHTILGKDHFVTITGEYEYTCFANRLSRLTRLTGPIRYLASPDDLRPEGHPINAPRELLRLVNWLMTVKNIPEDLFFAPVDENLIATIREALDTGEEFPFTPEDSSPSVVLAFGATLLRFFDSLPEPVVPETLHARCIQMTNRDEAFELLDAFPPPSVNVWITLTAFLHFICQTSTETSKTEKIATIFAPVLLREDSDSAEPPISPVGKRNFLMYFIL